MRAGFVVLLTIATLVAVSGCEAKRDWNVASAEDTIEKYQWFLKEHPNSSLADIARERIFAKRHPLAKQGYPDLEFTGFAPCRCGGTERVVYQRRVVQDTRGFTVIKDTIVSYEDLKSIFGWNQVERLYRPAGAQELSGVMFGDKGSPGHFGENCLGNVLISGEWRRVSGGILFMKGSLLWQMLE